jgi:hypothetical protein
MIITITSLGNVQLRSPCGELAPYSIDNQLNSVAPPTNHCARALTATDYVTYLIADFFYTGQSSY